MNFIIVFIVIHGNTIHNAVVDGQTVDKDLGIPPRIFL